MNRKTHQVPKFKSESEEADWWASRAGREYVKQKSADAESEGNKAGGSRLIAKMNQKSSVQIAIRLPQADLAGARNPARLILTAFNQHPISFVYRRDRKNELLRGFRRA